MTTHVFDETHISKGVRPVAQHGMVSIEDGALSLLGSDGRLIDSAPLHQVSASPARFSGGKTVVLRINGTRYTISPHWGDRAGHLLRPGRPEAVEHATGELLRLIDEGSRSVV